MTSAERARALVDKLLSIDGADEHMAMAVLVGALDEARADGMGEALDIAQDALIISGAANVRVDWSYVDAAIAQRQAALRGRP